MIGYKSGIASPFICCQEFSMILIFPPLWKSKEKKIPYISLQAFDWHID